MVENQLDHINETKNQVKHNLRKNKIVVYFFSNILIFMS